MSAQLLDVPRYLLGAHSLLDHAPGSDDELPDAGREVTAVYRIDVPELTGGLDGMHVCARQRRAQVEVHDVVALLDEGREVIQVLLHVDGRGLGQAAVLAITCEDVFGADVHVVQMVDTAEDDMEGVVMDVVALLELGTQVAGAVGAQQDFSHWCSAKQQRPAQVPAFHRYGGGRCRVRTCGLDLVRVLRSRCANRPHVRRDSIVNPRNMSCFVVIFVRNTEY